VPALSITYTVGDYKILFYGQRGGLPNRVGRPKEFEHYELKSSNNVFPRAKLKLQISPAGQGPFPVRKVSGSPALRRVRIISVFGYLKKEGSKTAK